MIEFQNVWMQFASEVVLKNISLSVREGLTLGLIGTPSSGKTVLMKLAAGLIRPTRGEVLIGGQPITALSEHALFAVRQRIGMLFQNNALFDYMTVAQNIAFPLEQERRHSVAEITARVTEALEKVRLPGIERLFPNEISGGMKKRVGIARATVAKPSIVFYDEPTAGLDPVTSSKIYNLIRDLQTQHRATSIAISTDIDGIRQVSDRVAMLHKGELCFEGTTDELEATRDPLVYQFIRGEMTGPL
ncbi:MAG: ATP-binding cassette domain-containing protein [Deltaproteobacteria bacterium]|nr:ATP-binding cassette domain-containing protein [Deltaproteobacteria bacterium]